MITLPNMDMLKQLALETARSLQEDQAQKAVEPYAEAIREIDPSHVKLCIDNSVLLRDIVQQDVLENEAVSIMVTMDSDLLVAVLRSIHPPLAAVLSDPKGMAWLESNRMSLGG